MRSKSPSYEEISDKIEIETSKDENRKRISSRSWSRLSLETEDRNNSGNSPGLMIRKQDLSRDKSFVRSNEKEQLNTSSSGEEGKRKARNSDYSFTQAFGEKIIRDREGNRFRNKFQWPSRFTHNETHLRNVVSLPENVASIGIKLRKPFFGQVTDKREPKPNADGENWNLHFIMGIEGSLTQVWVFGPVVK